MKEEFIPDCIPKQCFLDISAENRKFPLTLEVNHYVWFFKTMKIWKQGSDNKYLSKGETQVEDFQKENSPCSNFWCIF